MFVQQWADVSDKVKLNADVFIKHFKNYKNNICFPQHMYLVFGTHNSLHSQ